MKVKKFLSILCAASIFLMNSGTMVHAEGLPGFAKRSAENDVALPIQEDNMEQVALASDITVPGVETSSAELQSAGIGSYHLESAQMIQDLSKAMPYSADSVTQSFTDYLTAEGDAKFVQFSLGEGDIVNASLVCPDSGNLDYDLALATVGDDGKLTLIDASNLGTYIDPDTGKTADEGISYIHNQATVGNFAILVVATKGSSAQHSFTMTLSLDAAGSYDSHEPNDSPFTATALSSLRANGSLHVRNDQDWYAVKTNSGVYKVAAGDYQTEVYRVGEGNIMIRAAKAGSNYVLGNGTYYVRVYSDAGKDGFTFGDYTLEMEDQSKYATMQTAFDLGDWEHSYAKRPEVIPKGQQQAYYKFSIDAEDKVYASLLLVLNTSGTLIEFLNNNGTTIDYGFSGDESVDLPVRGLIQKSNSSLHNLVVNVNGTQTNSVAYLRITKVDPLDISSGGSPSVNTRIRSGYDTFRFSGTAKNPGNSLSTVLTMNLTNNSNIPPNAVVDRISTSSSISYGVGGVYHQLNPGGQGWVASRTTNATSGSFDLAGYGIQAKQPWQFRYSQTAFMSTEMRSVEMNIYWDYDIQYTNYELFK